MDKLISLGSSREKTDVFDGVPFCLWQLFVQRLADGLMHDGCIGVFLPDRVSIRLRKRSTRLLLDWTFYSFLEVYLSIAEI